ncbi:MAG: PAS domain-containing protein, partial [Pyrinomonadaceae bacterium]
MSLRLTPALIVGGTLLAACAALFLWSPAVAAVACAFLFAGALAARLVGDGRDNSPATPVTQLTARQPARQNESGAAAAPAVADEVPASTLLEATMDSMREGVLVVDGAMRVVASNRAARELFGSGEELIPARRLSELTRNPSIHVAFTAALERGERAEVKVETLDSDRRFFDLRVAPLGPPGGGEARGAIGVFFNITRLERLERVRQEFLSN